MTTIGVSEWMFLLVPAHPGCPRQNPQRRKTVVCMCVWFERLICNRNGFDLCVKSWQYFHMDNHYAMRGSDALFPNYYREDLF